jgi:hypothetical protein
MSPGLYSSTTVPASANIVPIMAETAELSAVHVFDRKKTALWLILIGPVLIGAAGLMLLTGEIWRRGALLGVVTVVALPIMSVGWWSVFSRRRRHEPALVIDPSGVRINMLLAAVPWIPRDQFGSLDIERRWVGGTKLSWLRVGVVDKAALTAGLSLQRRLLLFVEGGHVRIPASNLDRSSDELAAIIRAMVMSPPSG